MKNVTLLTIFFFKLRSFTKKCCMCICLHPLLPVLSLDGKQLVMRKPRKPDTLGSRMRAFRSLTRPGYGAAATIQDQTANANYYTSASVIREPLIVTHKNHIIGVYKNKRPPPTQEKPPRSVVTVSYSLL
ncbi:hypothetical protein GDO78_021434 [Eleutherodactylus coqui]|uniref:Uncharacterized protein n=1 Tax=Eleutherodactylus coqui TaxID=57060 RepID=A0A8J6E9X1_ELECQ|nr:hypothetical protein GDO78_021434 [Eleutherodactylus coqui]